MKKTTKHRWWLCNAIWASLLVVAHCVLFALGRHVVGWLLVSTVPVAAVQWVGWRLTRAIEPVREPRTPAFPGGKDCPPGCCPICGMEDRDGTVYAWGVGLGVRRAHIACVEWLGEIPAFDPVALDPDGDVRRQLETEDPGGPWTRRRNREEQRKRRMEVPTVAGIRPSEMREILREMGNPSPPPTERQIDQFIILKVHEQERGELAAYRTVVGNPDAMLPRCACGQKILACPACYTPYCPVCEQRHVFDCGRKWEQQPRQINVWACHDCGRTVMPPTDPRWLTTIEQ